MRVIRTDASSGGAPSSSAPPPVSYGPDTGLFDRGYAGSCSAMLKVAQMVRMRRHRRSQRLVGGSLNVSPNCGSNCASCPSFARICLPVGRFPGRFCVAQPTTAGPAGCVPQGGQRTARVTPVPAWNWLATKSPWKQGGLRRREALREARLGDLGTVPSDSSEREAALLLRADFGQSQVLF